MTCLVDHCLDAVPTFPLLQVCLWLTAIQNLRTFHRVQHGGDTQQLHTSNAALVPASHIVQWAKNNNKNLCYWVSVCTIWEWEQWSLIDRSSLMLIGIWAAGKSEKIRIKEFKDHMKTMTVVVMPYVKIIVNNRTLHMQKFIQDIYIYWRYQLLRWLNVATN